MPIQEGGNCVYAKRVPTSVAATDAAVVKIPFTGSGYAVRRVTQYNSRLLTTGATASNAATTIGVFGGAGGTGAVIVADAAVAALTGITVVGDRSIASTALTPIVSASDLYIRVGTASGVANSGVDVVIEYSVLP